MRAKRDYAMLAMLFGCGFRRSELVGLELDDIQMRQGHWAVVDLIGKGGHIRTVPIPAWVKAALDQWTRAAGVREGKIFRAVARLGKVWGRGISQNVGWYVVRTCARRPSRDYRVSLTLLFLGLRSAVSPLGDHQLRQRWVDRCQFHLAIRNLRRCASC